MNKKLMSLYLGLTGIGRVSATIVFLLFPFTHAFAQPEGGELLRELEQQGQPELPTTPKPHSVPEPPAVEQGPRVQVERFVFVGNTLLSDAELEEVVKDWTNKKLTMGELQYVADLVAQRYRRAGYLVRAYLPRQDIEEGSVRIVIVEARLGEVRVEDGGVANRRISQRFVQGTISARQSPGETLALGDIERAIQILGDTPGVNAKTLLVASEKEGHTDIVVNVVDEALLAGSITVDNFGSLATGIERINAGFSIDNPSGFGDQFQFLSQLSEGSRYARLRYVLPVGRDGMRAGVNVSGYRYELGEEFEASEAEGDATTWGADLRYPLLRARLSNVNLTARVEQRVYENRQLGETTSDKKIDALTLGLSGDAIDGLGGGGINFYSLSLVSGRLDLSGNAADLQNDEDSAQRHGSYEKLAWSLGRLQQINDKTTFWTSIRGQSTGGNLDSSEGFGIGGPNAVRAYPALEGSGDEGWLSTIELRYRLHPNFTLTTFYNQGRIRHYKESWAGWNTADPDQPLTYDLKGAGLGLTWAEPGHFSVQLLAARRLGTNPLADSDGNDSDGTLRLNRFWFTASHYF